MYLSWLSPAVNGVERGCAPASAHADTGCCRRYVDGRRARSLLPTCRWRVHSRARVQRRSASHRPASAAVAEAPPRGRHGWRRRTSTLLMKCGPRGRPSMRCELPSGLQGGSEAHAVGAGLVAGLHRAPGCAVVERSESASSRCAGLTWSSRPTDLVATARRPPRRPAVRAPRVF